MSKFYKDYDKKKNSDDNKLEGEYKAYNEASEDEFYKVDEDNSPAGCGNEETSYDGTYIEDSENEDDLGNDKKIIENINAILQDKKRSIVGILLIICCVASFNIFKNLLFNGSDVKTVRKNNIKSEDTVKLFEKENKKLEKDIAAISAVNIKTKEELEKATNVSFKAVAGSTWQGKVEYKDNSEAIAVELEIKKEEIVLHANNLKWNRLENQDATFDAKILLSTGDINKQTGYMKLNRLSLTNPPQSTQEWSDECMPYNYELVANDNYITGFVLQDNQVVGNMYLKQAK